MASFSECLEERSNLTSQLGDRQRVADDEERRSPHSTIAIARAAARCRMISSLPPTSGSRRRREDQQEADTVEHEGRDPVVVADGGL
jgi:hypothetical protein